MVVHVDRRAPKGGVVAGDPNGMEASRPTQQRRAAGSEDVVSTCWPSCRTGSQIRGSTCLARLFDERETTGEEGFKTRWDSNAFGYTSNFCPC